MALIDLELRGFLKDEYLLLQDQYEDFDRRTLTIKGWIATGAVAALAISFGSSNKYSYLIPILVALLAAVFWYLEGYWRLFQEAIGDRIRVIEAYFRADREIFERNPDPFQIYHRFYLSFTYDQPLYDYEKKEGRPRRRYKRIWKIALQPFVCLPYLVIVVLSLAVFALLLVTR
jgi:hypothetical protein